MTNAPKDPLDWLDPSRERPRSGRSEYRDELARCDELLVGVGTIVANLIMPATNAFLQADTHAAQEAIAADLQVARRCRELEEACYVLIARQAPVAGDLRRVVAILRSVPDVQRAATLNRHVAESLTWVHPPSMPEELRQTILELGTVSAEIFKSAVRAWQAHDALAAMELQAADDQVDLLQKYLLTELYTGQQAVEEAVSLALIARYYERIADRGVEMARQVAYYVTGERIVEQD